MPLTGLLAGLATAGLIGIPVLPADTSSIAVPRTATTPSCDVLVALNGARDSLYKIGTNGSTTELKLADHPIDVVTSSDGRTAYVAGHERDEVYIVDVVSMTRQTTIGTEAAPIDLALSPDDSTLYVAATGGVNVIDTNTRRATRFIDLASSPFAIELSPDGTLLFAALAYEDELVVVDLSTDSTRRVAIPASSESMIITPDGRYVFITHRSIDRLSRVRTSDLRVETIAVGDAPRGIDVLPNGAAVYVVNQDAHTVSVVDTESLTSSTTIAVGDGAYDVTIDDDGKRAYVNNYWQDDMSVIDTSTRTVIGTLALGSKSESWGIDTACRSSVTLVRPSSVNDLFIFANFFCGPCTNAWILFTRPANTSDFSVFVDGRRTTCTQKGYFFDLALCELTGLTPGKPTAFSVVPVNGSVAGRTAATTMTLRR